MSMDVGVDEQVRRTMFLVARRNTPHSLASAPRLEEPIDVGVLCRDPLRTPTQWYEKRGEHAACRSACGDRPILGSVGRQRTRSNTCAILDACHAAPNLTLSTDLVNAG